MGKPRDEAVGGTGYFKMNGSAKPARKAPPVPMLVCADVSAIKDSKVTATKCRINMVEAFTYLTNHMLLICVVSMPIYYEVVDSHLIM